MLRIFVGSLFHRENVMYYNGYIWAFSWVLKVVSKYDTNMLL